MATRLRSDLIDGLRVAGFANAHIRDLTNEAADVIEQLTNELDARFEHSDHTAAKYYRRMREAEKEAAAVVDRIRALIEPLPAIERIFAGGEQA